MMRCAVVCAFNLGNSGMYSTELAANQFLSRIGIDYDFCITQGKITKKGIINYRRIKNIDEFSEYDAIIYWADFQNNPMWGVNDFLNREKRENPSRVEEEAIDGWRNIYLRLHDILPETTKIYSIGGCFIGAPPYLDQPDIRKDFYDFLRTADGIIVRDNLSFQILEDFHQNTEKNISLGFDVASLLRPVRRFRWSFSKYFVYAFRRTLPEAEGDRLATFIGEKLQLKPVKIEWWPNKISNRSFNSNLSTMGGAQFALTDIYHFAIDCLTQQTMPVCIYDPASEGESTVSDLKKKILFEMIDGDGFLVPVVGNKLDRDSETNVLEIAARILGSSGFGLAPMEAFDYRREVLESLIKKTIFAP